MTRRNGIVWLFGVYLLGLAIATLAPPPISPSNGLFGTNLVPVVRSIACYEPDPGQPSTTAFCTRIFLGNIALFIPFGLLFPLVFRQRVSAKAVALAALALSVSIEILQYAGRWIASARWTDVDDVIFNVAGALFGYGMLLVIGWVARRTDYRPG